MEEQQTVDGMPLDLIVELAAHRTRESMRTDRRWWLSFAVMVGGIAVTLSVTFALRLEGQFSTKIQEAAKQYEEQVEHAAKRRGVGGAAVAAEEAGTNWQMLRANGDSIVTLNEGESTLLEIDISAAGV